MKISKINSLENATDRDLLLIILSNQIQLARKIELVQNSLKNSDIEPISKLADDMVYKLDTFLDVYKKAFDEKS